MKKFFFPIIILLFISCKDEVKQPSLATGMWRTVLEVQDQKELPFIFEWTPDSQMIIHNAEERIVVDDVKFSGDSIVISHPVFEGVFKGVFSEKEVRGNFIKPSLDRIVPFVMTAGVAKRFDSQTAASTTVTGSWELLFSAHSDEDRYVAKGIFEQTSNGIVTGTIRTTTGDYRYLEGIVDGNTIKLSTFDGAHAFLFEAEIKDSLLFGNFYSGNHWKEPFSGKRNNNYELPDANSLTFLKEGYDRFDFSFPDTEGEIISMSDSIFQDRVVVVQIMGTWCPNCLEETQYYTDYIQHHPSEEVQFVSLAFEYAPTRARAVQGIQKLKEAVEVPYPILLAQYGTSSKEKANDKLPMLNHVLSYPTTVFIDKKGAVRKIHTGFNGKATGAKYEDFKKDFEGFLEKLLAE